MILLGVLLYGLGAVFWTALALVYGLRSPWRESAMGRAVFTSWAALAAVLVLAVVLPFLRLPLPVELGLAVLVLTAVDIAGLVLLVRVLRLQRGVRE